jgi:tetratricopeptide (TPR) repeat protein
MFGKTLVMTLLLNGACLSLAAQHEMRPQTPLLSVQISDNKLALAIPNLGDGSIEAGPVSRAARIAFENGVRLNNGFAEEEAQRAFQLAERLDPTCAMCYWGEAAALAPTINYTINQAKAAEAVVALAKADALSSGLSNKAKAIIAAERERYASQGGAWKVDDAAEWKAAAKLAAKYPDDDALQVNAANAAMIEAENGRPGRATADNPKLAEAEKLLNTVLQRSPDYTPTIHFYLHLTEWQGHPEASKEYASRLASLASSSGHMLHMASHIDFHTGQYEAAAMDNMRAAQADIDYVNRVQPPGGMESIPMHQHNLIYGLTASLLSGDERLSLKFARQLHDTAPKDGLWFAEPYLAFGRFLPAEEIFKMPAPKAALPSAFYHFALGEAYVRLNNSDAALKEAASINTIQKGAKFGSIDPRVVGMLTVVSRMLEGQAAMVRKDYSEAAALYEEAAKYAEENDPYQDPPVWPWPPRRSLAEALLLQGKLEAARQAVEGALKERPNDPTSLHVLATIDRETGNPDAAEIEEQSLKAWHGSLPQVQPAMI